MLSKSSRSNKKYVFDCYTNKDKDVNMEFTEKNNLLPDFQYDYTNSNY